MEKYIGVKMIEAKEMNLGEYNKYRGWEIPHNEDPSRLGYLVKYDNNYESWSPKEIFESAYFKLSGDGTKIMEEDVERFLGDVSIRQVDPKTALVTATTLTGFVQHEASCCVDPKNYNEELGKKYGKERIKSRLWHCMGFVLQWAKNGLR